MIEKTQDKNIIDKETIENIRNITKEFTKKEKQRGCNLLLEVAFNILFLPDALDVPIEGRSLGGEYKYSLNTIFTIINILKSYHIFKLAFHFASSFKFFSFNTSFLFKAAFH